MTTDKMPEGNNCEPENDQPGTPTQGKCDPLPQTCPPPDLPDPPVRPAACNCPGKPPETKTCFDDLIAAQAIELSRADQAKVFKAELEDILKKANAVKLSYSRAKYEEFKNRWDKEDEDIITAIEIVTCNIKCWWCVIECEVCRLFYAIEDLDMEINGKGKLSVKAQSLLDLQYWHQRNREAKNAQFQRIDAVVKAWNKPVETIDKALIENDKFLKTVRQLDPVDALIPLLLKVIPLHLAIAPRPIKTKINNKYIRLCDCDRGDVDDCCGPDTGMPSILQQQLGPQAYIVDPDDYFGILCCLVKERYVPAKEQLAVATSQLGTVNDKITRKKAELESRKKDPLGDALRNIARPVDCSKYTAKDGGADCGCDPGLSTTPQHPQAAY